MSYSHYNRGHGSGYRDGYSRSRRGEGRKDRRHGDRHDPRRDDRQNDGRHGDKYVDRYIDNRSDLKRNSNNSHQKSSYSTVYSESGHSIPISTQHFLGGSRPQELKEKPTGTNPVTGINPRDKEFAKFNHHRDVEDACKFPNQIDRKKNYRILDLANKSKSTRFNGGDLSSVRDPRLENVVHYFQKPNKSSKKFPFKQLPQTRFQYDKDTIGPPPQTELVVWDLPPTTHEVYLANYFKSFDGNSIKDIKFVSDPTYAVPLGIVSFKFHGNVEKAGKLAKQLVTKIRMEQPKIDGVPLKIELNDIDSKLLNSKIGIAKEKLRMSRKIREEQEKKARREMEEKRRIEEQKKLKEKRPDERKKEDTNLYKFKPNTTLLSRRHNNKVVPGVILPEDLKRYVKDRPYILIQDKYVPTRKITSLDIKRTLNKYDWTRIISDRSGFFIVFNSLKEAERCFMNEDGRKFYEYRLFMELATPEGFSQNNNEDDDLFSSKVTKHDIINEASNMLIKEFQSFLSKDIRERIIAPAVLDLLSHERYPELVEEMKAKEAAIKLSQPSVTESSQLKQAALSKLTKNKLNTFQQSLPSFKKKNISVKKPKKNLVPMQHALNFDHYSDDDEGYDSNTRSLTPVSSSKRERDSTVTSVEPEDGPEMEPESKKQKTGLRKTFLYESSSDEEMEDEEESNEVEVSDDLEMKEPVDENVPPENEDIDYTKSDEKYQPTEVKPRTVYPEAKMLPSDAFTLDSLQATIKDNEDLEIARLVLSEMEIEPSDFKNNIDYWAWKQKDLNSVSQEIVEDIELIGRLKDSLQNSTGSFRSEGYKKILEKDKIDYLPHRRKIHKPLKTVQHEDDDDDRDNNGKSSVNGTSTTSNTNGIQSSRVNRANNRRFAADITAQIGNESEVLSLNALTKRKKPVSFARSAIHNWGLYALEPIAAKEMIIEYVGEQIRQQVAEHREKSYLKTGIGSSYLFRIDENTVIDATKKGGIARFINHCCNPSCTAKIIKVEGTKRIVIYALRDIDANEELTYDYKFERETNDEERIPCLCGAPGCKGYLN